MKRLLLVLVIIFCGALEVNAEYTYPSRWSGIVVHHSATNSGTVESIRRYHVNHNGWDDIGYHFVIYRNGEIHSGRDLNTDGAHARGRNHTYVGVCLIGTDTFTDAQRESLRYVVLSLKVQFPYIDTVERHHEECPGPGIELDGLNDIANQSVQSAMDMLLWE